MNRRSDGSKHSYGVKADNLGLLVKAGFPVPDFITLHADELDAAASRGHEGLVELVNAIHERETAFFKRYDRFAVRSSANNEDGRHRSMAGLYESRVNVSSENLAVAIAECMAASAADRVTMLSGTPSRLNLIIQAMVVNQRHAGILFTANPDGLLNERVLVVGEGSGSDLVEDKVPAVTYYFHKTEKLAYFENPYGLDLPTETVIDKIRDLSDLLENQFGPALDLEIAIADDTVYLLQMRPITTFDPAVFSRPGTVLDNSNIVESYPGITSPLSTDFYSQAYNGIFTRLIKRLLPVPKPKQAERLADIAENMVFSWNGRAYYQLQNWLLLLRHLPFSGRFIPVWKTMMGISGITSYDTTSLLGPLQRFGCSIRLLISIAMVDKEYNALKEAVEEIEAEFRNLRQSPNKLTLYEIFYERVRYRLLQNWDITLLNDVLAMHYSSTLTKKLEQAGHENPHAAISGIQSLESLKPLYSISSIGSKLAEAAIPRQLLEQAASDDELAEAILDGTLPSLQSEACQELLRLLNEHIRLYGDRSVEELKLERKTQRSHPSLLFHTLLDPPDINARELTLPSAGKHQKLQKKTHAAIARREESRLLRSRVYGIVRSIFRDMGQALYIQGQIHEPDDVFWLHTDEVFLAYREGGKQDETIRTRKKEYEVYQTLPAYGQLIFAKKPFSKKKAGVNQLKGGETPTQLDGISSSAGVVEGAVKVLLNPADAADVKGKILVTVNTDPGWVYLLMQAKGVIAERGSVLSHTAILSRELGLPSVVGVEGACSILRDGDIVRLDANRGVITWVKR